MTAHGADRRTTRPLIGVILGALLVTLTAAGCSSPAAGSTDLVPTYIPQPTPDPTMREVIAGRGSPVVYLPPLDIRGSPTAAPAAARPASSGSTTRPAAKPAAPARVPAPPAAAPGRKPAAPAPAAPAPAPKPAVVPAPAPTAIRSGPALAPAPRTGGTGSSAPPSLFNPSNALPSGPARPNPTPSR